MHIEGHQRSGLLYQLQEVSPQRLLMRYDVARSNVGLQVCLLSQVTPQDQNSRVGLFDQLYETGLG